jgi:hypothetical protein
MTEDVKVEDKQEPVVEVEKVEPSVSELSPVEQQAIDQGWVPLEDWEAQGRSKDEWRPAKEFVDRGELYKSIHSTKRELKQTQAALTALQRHNQYIFEKAYTQAQKDLRAEKRLAIRNEDFERLEEIETELEQLNDQHVKEKQELAQVQAQTATSAVAPEFQIWLDRNPWYLTDEKLKDEAEAAGFIYLNKGNSKEGLLAHVEKTVKEKFPEKFGKKRSAPSAVAAVDRTGKKAPKADDVELSAEERQVMRTFVDMGVMSEAEYIKQLKKAGR